MNQFEAPNKLGPDGKYPLTESIDKAYALGDYPALWAVEGLGKNYAYAYLKAGKPMVKVGREFLLRRKPGKRRGRGG